MTTFRYGPVAVQIEHSQLPDRTLFEKMFISHASWLADHDIAYTVLGFRWPDLLTILFSRDKRVIAIEFDLLIDDDVQAVLFRLFSGVEAVT